MFNNKLVESLSKSSMIRAMFEKAPLKIYGDDKVYDFSLETPVEPPVQVLETLKNYVNRGEQGLHKYMNNAGFPDVRQKVAAYVQKNSGVQMNENNIVMVCGAAAGLNVTLKAILNPGEEVIVLAPFFVEYGTYIEHANGKTVVVNTKKDSFQIDVKAVEDAITEKTKAIIINSPNNPTGVIYSRNPLKA